VDFHHSHTQINCITGAIIARYIIRKIYDVIRQSIPLKFDGKLCRPFGLQRTKRMTFNNYKIFFLRRKLAVPSLVRRRQLWADLRQTFAKSIQEHEETLDVNDPR
jgi:hypothetical protein